MDPSPTIDLARVAMRLGLPPEQVANVTALLDDGNTVPFITRYRKERTGNLDEEQIRGIQQAVTSARQIAERAETILRLIDAQGKLTPELRAAIREAESLKRLEDLYLPYRPKRRSRALLARERGLGPLAERIWNGDQGLGDLEAATAPLVDPQNDLPTVTDVLQGAADVLAERIAEDAELRAAARRVAWQTGALRVSPTKEGEQKGHEYRDYFNYSEAVSRIPPHRVLAINRGEKSGALRVRFSWDDARAQATAVRRLNLERHRFGGFLERCAADALSRLLQPSLDREVRRELTERAEAHAVQVFARNLRNLLMQPPIRGQRVLAVDPGFRTGCKVAVLDEVGNVVATDVIYVTGSAEKRAAVREKVARLMRDHGCLLAAIGNGTACRESEELISETISEHLPEARYVIVNEAGASIYSTSTVAREEFPDFDATVRGTISIGRRLLDPLSELVKIDPQHIGVGMYQHDVSPRLLRESLDQVIESCVNYVGVDLNTASASLLRYVSGFNQLIARRVAAWRDEHGRFADRRQLLEVPGVGQATFTQAAGFLKIRGGREPLDGTWIHPESYDAVRMLLRKLSLSPESLAADQPPQEAGLPAASRGRPLQDRLRELDAESTARELQVGLPTFHDILDALSRPGRDPRADLPGPVFKRGILKLEDLSEGMELTGTVLNVVDFGAFVDVGLKDSGLVHISRMASRYVKTPHEVVSVGDRVTVWVLGVDRDRRRVSLTMVRPGAPAEADGSDGSARESSARSRAPEDSPSSSARPQSARLPAATKREPLRGFGELKELWNSRGK